MLPLASLDESESLLMPLLDASLLPDLPEVLSAALGNVLLLSVALGELIDGLGDVDSLVLGDVVVVLGDVELLGGVLVVVSDGVVVVDDGGGRVLCVVVELSLSVVDWA
jgi:hypothetical protein